MVQVFKTRLEEKLKESELYQSAISLIEEYDPELDPQKFAKAEVVDYLRAHYGKLAFEIESLRVCVMLLERLCPTTTNNSN